VIATDGSKGVRDFAHIPAGAELAAARTKEASCAAKRLGVRQLHLLGLPDGGLASFDVLGKLRSALVAIIDSLGPAVVITFGPEGGTGHPDHRLVGDVTTQIVQSDARYANVDLLYASLPTERLRTAPPANPTVNGMAESLLTVRVPFEERDLAAGREEFACHRTQYAPAEEPCGCVRGTGRCTILESSDRRRAQSLAQIKLSVAWRIAIESSEQLIAKLFVKRARYLCLFRALAREPRVLPRRASSIECDRADRRPRRDCRERRIALAARSMDLSTLH